MCMLTAVSGITDTTLPLLERITAQEALFGGYYSGVCTLSNGAFSLKKEVGPISALKFSALKSGLDLTTDHATTGLAHSRTNGGGSSKRAQPFVDSNFLVAGIGTGVHGIFGKEYQNARQLLANELFSSGVTFSSAEHGVSGSAELPDGSTVHNTELFIQAVGYLVKLGEKPTEAIRKAFKRMPAEGAYILIFSNNPNELLIANYNMRLLTVAHEKGAIIATSILGLTDTERRTAKEVPMNSLTIYSKHNTDCSVLDDTLWTYLDKYTLSDENIENAFLSYLAKNPNTTWSTIVEHAVMPLFPNKKANLLVPLALQAIERLIFSHRVSMSKISVEGAVPGTHAVQAVFRI